MAELGNTFSFTNGYAQIPNVAKAASSTPTQAEFNALIDALIDSGLMAPAEDGD